MAYIDYPLDHVMPEGIKELGDVVNQFILCNRCEIILDGLTTPKDNEAPLPTSSSPIPKFKEASLPSSPKEKEASTLPTSLVQPKYPFRSNEQVL
jgi:hypothetical protein